MTIPVPCSLTDDTTHRNPFPRLAIPRDSSLHQPPFTVRLPTDNCRRRNDASSARRRAAGRPNTQGKNGSNPSGSIRKGILNTTIEIYVTEQEGTDYESDGDSEPNNEETLDDAVESLIPDIQSLPASSTEDEAELFLATFGTIPDEKASQITTHLADRSFLHAITGINPTVTPKPMVAPEAGTGFTITPDKPTPQKTVTPRRTCNDGTCDPFAYTTTTDRYTSNKFYGVVIDTGASKRSTAEFGQYLAYTKTHAASLDTTRAGLVNVQFGIGSASSIGSITIETPVGNVEFHVVHAVTEISHGISIETGFTSLGSVFRESQYVYECICG